MRKSILCLSLLAAAQPLFADFFSKVLNTSDQKATLEIQIPEKTKMFIQAKGVSYNNEMHQLEDAILHNEHSKVLNLTKKDIDINQQFMSGLTPLQFAIFVGHSEIAYHLIDQGAQADITCISLALKQNDKELAQTLKKACARPIDAFFYQCTYVAHTFLETVIEPLKKYAYHCFHQNKTGYYVHKKDKKDVSHVLAALEILIKSGFNPNSFWAADLEGSWWLRNDAQTVNKVIETLIKNGADPNYTYAPDATYKTTPLLAAIKQENEQAIQVLLFVGADANKGGLVHEIIDSASHLWLMH